MSRARDSRALALALAAWSGAGELRAGETRRARAREVKVVACIFFGVVRGWWEGCFWR